MNEIADYISKPVEETERYIKTFNSRYNEIEDMG